MGRRFELCALLVLVALTGCTVKTTSLSPSPSPDAGKVDSGAPVALDGCTNDPGAPAVTVDPNATSDPAGGADKFTLAQALAGFPAGAGKLTVLISTEKSAIRCELLETTAPISVANFVGLARGTRPYKER